VEFVLRAPVHTLSVLHNRDHLTQVLAFDKVAIKAIVARERDGRRGWAIKSDLSALGERTVAAG
jgi:hypothetical protein